MLIKHIINVLKCFQTSIRTLISVQTALSHKPSRKLDSTVPTARGGDGEVRGHEYPPQGFSNRLPAGQARLLHGVTGNCRSLNQDARRRLGPAAVGGERAARVERAARRWVERARHLAFHLPAACPDLGNIGHGVEQHPSIGMQGPSE